MTTRFGFMDLDQGDLEHDVSGALQGLLGCLTVGLAHLTPEQRRLYDDDAEPNMLLTPVEQHADLPKRSLGSTSP